MNIKINLKKIKINHRKSPEIDSLKKLSFNSIPPNIKSRAFVYTWPTTSNSTSSSSSSSDSYIEPLQPNDIAPVQDLRVNTITITACGASESNSKPKSNPALYYTYNTYKPYHHYYSFYLFTPVIYSAILECWRSPRSPLYRLLDLRCVSYSRQPHITISNAPCQYVSY